MVITPRLANLGGTHCLSFLSFLPSMVLDAWQILPSVTPTLGFWWFPVCARALCIWSFIPELAITGLCPQTSRFLLMLLSSLSTSQYFYFIVGLLNLYDSPLKVFRSHLNVLICLSCVLIPSSTFSFVTLAYFKGADLVLWRFSVVLWRQVSLYVLCCCAGFGVCTFAPCVKWGWGVLWSTHWVYSVIFPAELLCLPWFLLWILLWFVGWAQIFPLRISLWDNPSFHVLLNSVTLLLSFTFHLPKHIDFYMFLCSICSICPFPLSLLFIVCHPGMLSLHSCLSRAFILPAAWGCRVLLFHWCFLDSHVYRVGSEEPGYGSETLHF